MIGGAVLAVIGLIFYIIGIVKAKADEASFTKAMICVLVSLAISIVVAFLSKQPVIKNVLQIIQNIVNLGATVFIILGIRTLAQKLNREDIDDYGKLTMRLLIIIYAASTVASILAAVFAGNQSVQTVSNVVAIIAALFQIAAYVIYLVFLNKSVKMLEA